MERKDKLEPPKASNDPAIDTGVEPLAKNNEAVDSNELFNSGDVNETKIRPVNESLYRDYTVTDTRKGNEYLWKNTQEVAFKDKGNKLTAKSSSEKVALSMVELAESKGWTSIKVKGDIKFKRQTWLEASLRGLEVAGYKPTEQDRYTLEQTKTHNSISKLDADIKTNKTELGIDETLKKDLDNAYNTLDRTQATTRYPQLVNLYDINEAAVHFAEATIADKQSQDSFKSAVHERSLTELARGHALPTVKAQTNTKEQGAQQEAER